MHDPTIEEGDSIGDKQQRAEQCHWQDRQINISKLFDDVLMLRLLTVGHRQISTEQRRQENDRGKSKYWQKNVWVPPVSTANHTWTDLGWRLNCCSSETRLYQTFQTNRITEQAASRTIMINCRITSNFGDQSKPKMSVKNVRKLLDQFMCV